MSVLDEREQRYSYMAASLGAAASVGLWAHAFDEAAGVALAAIGVGMAALLAAAARRRSRLLTGLGAALLSFGPWGTFWLIGLPFLALAAWLMVRAPRRDPRSPEDPGSAKVRGRRRRRGGTPTDEKEDATPALRQRPGPPPASRRYTPPQRKP